jgi:lipopolysaccharide export system protein LptA
MSTYKTTSGDFTLTCENGNGVFTINAQTVFTGNVTYNQPSTTTSAFLTVAANNTGAITDMGLLAQTGVTSFAGLRFDSGVSAWQISPNVYGNGAPITAYANIGSAAAGANTNIQYNNNGVFGGNSKFSYDFANSVLTLQGYEILGNIGTAPAAPSNAVAIYNNAVGDGATGVYVISSNVDDELISANQARKFAIIF